VIAALSRTAGDYWTGFSIGLAVMLGLAIMIRGRVGFALVLAGVAAGFAAYQKQGLEATDVNNRSLVGLLALGGVVGVLLTMALPTKKA
jgi:hypothetical protein